MPLQRQGLLALTSTVCGRGTPAAAAAAAAVDAAADAAAAAAAAAAASPPGIPVPPTTPKGMRVRFPASARVAQNTYARTHTIASNSQYLKKATW